MVKLYMVKLGSFMCVLLAKEATNRFIRLELFIGYLLNVWLMKVS